MCFSAGDLDGRMLAFVYECKHFDAIMFGLPQKGSDTVASISFSSKGKRNSFPPERWSASRTLRSQTAFLDKEAANRISSEIMAACHISRIQFISRFSARYLP
jgi:hypothetical protein